MKTLRKLILLSITTTILSSCVPKTSVQNKAGIDPKSFQKELDGKKTNLYVLTNKNGIEITATNYGGLIVSIETPDKSGKFSDIALGFNKLDDYMTSSPYFGAAIGRYGNRIKAGKFLLDSVEYSLPINNGPNSLHGGLKGFDKVVWDATQIDDQTLELKYSAKDMEEGYPGNLNIKMVYNLNDNNELKITYEATTDKPTVINLTQHSYFNLAGEGSGTILDHIMMINADHITPVDSTLIPTGILMPVAGTPMDFRTPMAIGSRIDSICEQLKFGLGYDHNYVLNQSKPGEMVLAARVVEPTTGRTLEVETDQPGIQFYCGNFLKGDLTGKSGRPYNFRNGFCLETQHFPDSPNQPNFPSTVLRPGETYHHTCIYRFGVE